MNFIGLQPEILRKISIIVDDFKEKNKNDRKKEAILTDMLGDLIINKEMKMEYFAIPNKIIGITNPEDELIVRKLLR